MTPVSERQPEIVDLVKNYRPLGIRAVQAAVTIKGQSLQSKEVARPAGTGLPEGFHWPGDLNDD